MKTSAIKFEGKKAPAVEDAIHCRKVKNLSMQLNAGHSNLAHEIKQAFDLAKSSGLELDLTFTRETIKRGDRSRRI